MVLPPHVTAMLETLRTRHDVPASLFEMFEELKTLGLDTPLEERWYRWESAMDELRRCWR